MASLTSSDNPKKVIICVIILVSPKENQYPQKLANKKTIPHGGPASVRIHQPSGFTRVEAKWS